MNPQSKAKQLWVLKDAVGDYLTWEPTRHTMLDFHHVVDYSAYENLQKENDILREALVRYEAAKNDVIRYCYPNSDIFWAAKIIGILLNCDFRDSPEEAKEYLEKVKSEWE